MPGTAVRSRSPPHQPDQQHAEAFGQDPEFFDFYRSLQAYRTALGDGATTFVLSPDSEFFRFFNGRTNAPAAPAPGPGASLAAGGTPAPAAAAAAP